MGGGRTTCPRCGANNFDTVTACWKCGTPLQGAPAAQPVSAPAPVRPQATPGVGERFAGYTAAAATAVASTTGNPRTANAAAVWLGLLFPYFGIPIGLAFMMCDDRRRQEVGRICLLWSIVSSIAHFLLLVVSLLGMREYFQMALGALKAQAGRAGGLGGMGGGGLGGE